jgi:hypothetical protein
MPSLFKSKQLTLSLPARLLPLSMGIMVAISCTSLLTACGGGGSGSARVIDDKPTTPTPEKTYSLTVRSQVAVKNATVTLTDASTKKVIASKTITSLGSDFVFDIKESDINGGILVATLSGEGNQSQYYDPTLNSNQTPLNGSLHSVLVMIKANATTMINPFTEIDYQRALVRSGSMDKANPDISLLDISSLGAASTETTITFGVKPTLLTPIIAQRSDLSKLIYNKAMDNPPNSDDQYFNIFMSMGHYMLQKNENSTDKTPYLTFAKRAAEDMRDGSLDGYTIFGGNTDNIINSNRLINPMVSNARTNTFPDLTTNSLLTIAEFQKSTRESYGELLKNQGVLKFFATLPVKDTEGLALFTEFDYTEGRSKEFSFGSFNLHSYGAGNYKRAFGIEPIIITNKKYESIYDINCQGISKEYEPNTYYPDCKIGLSAVETDKRTNDIEALVGSYRNDVCSLDIYFNGKIVLTKGNQSMTNFINEKESDSLIRLQPNTQSYVLNVTSAAKSPVEFIQIRIENQKVLSAAAGSIEVDPNNPRSSYPISLTAEQEKFSCQFS